MRILFANDGFGDPGGVQSYLDAVVAGLIARGHDLAILHRDAEPAPFAAAALRSLPQFRVADLGAAGAADAVRAWQPDVCYSHNMNTLEVDRQLMAVAPVVKFMHGYFGTCVSGQKRFGFPVARPCARAFGPACAALYLPRRCGQLDPVKLVAQYRWAVEQHDLLAEYRALVVASAHMKREYVRNGVDASRVHVNPLFPTEAVAAAADTTTGPATPTVAFAARMTTLKGGDVLIRAVAEASARLASPIRLTMMGDGPQRPAWERLARDCRVDCTFTGWQSGEARWRWLGGATVLAVPSTWPEPFGLVGLEAAALGVPAVAFDVGGVREWLRPGENGYLVAGDPPRASAFAAALVRAFTHPEEIATMRQSAVEVARAMSLARHLDRLEAVLAGDARPYAHSAGR